MIYPLRRVWLYPVAVDKLEIVILGDITTASTYANLRVLCESWIGWSRVDTLVGVSGFVCGLHVVLGRHALHNDPIAEAMAMIRDRNNPAAHEFGNLRWCGGAPANDSAIGMVGTW